MYGQILRKVFNLFTILCMKVKEKGGQFQRHIDRHLMATNRLKFVSNHFNDVRTNRVFRVDPVVRFNARTLADTGGAPCADDAWNRQSGNGSGLYVRGK